MSEQSIASGQEFGSLDSDPADPAFVANLQQSANLANENCDRAVALAHKLSAQLQEAEDRINQLERERDSFFDQLLAEAKAAIQDVQSNADARLNRTIREADERIARLKAQAENQIGHLHNELAQATHGIDQIKAEADERIECVKTESDARVASVETDAKKRIDIIRRKNEDKVLRLEADLTQAKNRANRAEQWLMLIRREIEEHLMPAMRDGPNPTSSAARTRSSTVPMRLRSLASIWFRRLWLRVTTTALGCRVGADMESATAFDRASQHEPGFSSGLSVSKTGNAATASEPSRTKVHQLGADGQPVGPRIVEVAIEHGSETGVLAEATPGVSESRH
jgi:hypothetical protein